MFNVNCEKNNIIPIGYEGENKVEEVQFDFSEWVQDYGSGTIVLLHQRSADPAPYPVTLTTEGNVATWTLSSADTQYKGWGAAQLVYTVGEAIKKSAVYRTYNNASLGDSTDPPEPWETWVDEVIAAGNAAQEAAEGRGVHGRAVEAYGAFAPGGLHEFPEGHELAVGEICFVDALEVTHIFSCDMSLFFLEDIPLETRCASGGVREGTRLPRRASSRSGRARARGRRSRSA